MSNQIDQKRIAKNTLMLYIRMGITMLVSLYTSRIVLKTLGVEDFGIYNVVGGVVVMFSFMSLTLTVAIRRFLAFELGKDAGGDVYQIFNSSIIAVLVTSIILIIGLETLGYWFLNYQLNIPSGRLEAANFVFQLSVLSFFFSMNLIPFSAAIVSYEKMGVYAYFGILETALKLALVLSLPHLHGDKLRIYAFLVVCLSIFMASCNYIYCSKKVIRPRIIQFNWKDVKSIFEFSAWTVLGTIILMMATQGVNMIYNIFFGVAINAAMGIAQQVSNAVNQFIGNFQTAFTPQLTKNYSAEGLSDTTFKFACQTSRLTIFLLLLIGVPLMINITNVLDIWLDIVPNYAVPFTMIFLIYLAIDGSSGPLYLLVYAKGELKWYQIVLSAIQVVYILLVYICCVLGFDPVSVLAINIITGILLYIARLLLLKRIMHFPVKVYIQSVIYPLIIPLLLCTGFVIFGSKMLISLSVFETLISLVVSFIMVLAIAFFAYLKEDERRYVYSLVLTKYNKDKL